MRIERRLEQNAIAFVATDATLAQYTQRERIADETLRPETDPGEPAALPEPVLVITAQDNGRHSRTPIRSLRLSFIIRANAKTPAGAADPFDAICEALEQLLDNTNLKTALDSRAVAKGLAVMLAVRNPGSTPQTVGLLRMETFSVDVKAVAVERTV